MPSPEGSRRFTTFIASAWGLTSSYALIHSLLVTHDVRPCFAAMLPLIAVWATLERKRWGRLALLGMSATAIGLFAAALGFLAATGGHLFIPEQRTFQNYTQIAFRLYSGLPFLAWTTLLLAGLTGLWLKRPVVAAEFEKGKRAALESAQRGIAMSIVGCWGIILAFAPVMSGALMSSHGRSTGLPARIQQIVPVQDHRTNSRPNRSAALAIKG